MKTGIIGAGAISDIYLENMIHRFDALEVVSICANHMEHAKKQADKYGIKAVTLDEMLADPEVEMVVNLTPASVHYEIIKAALLAGKHVYTEKTITDTPDKAAELLELADTKGLCLAAAPDTFLGAALQTARKAIDGGLPGDIHSFVISANRDNNILLSLFSFLRQPGGGIVQDFGVYYITALVSLLGAVKRVGGIIAKPYPQHTGMIPQMPTFGKTMDTPNESQVSAVLQLENGVTGTFHINADCSMNNENIFAIYGTKGILFLPDPNNFGGSVKFLPAAADPRKAAEPVILNPVNRFTENARGIGPADMASAIEKGIAPRPSKEMAYHVLEVLYGILRGGTDGQFVDIVSRFEKPQPLDQKKIPALNVGHTSFNMKNNEAMLHFYKDILGMKEQFTLTFGDLAKMMHVGVKQDPAAPAGAGNDPENNLTESQRKQLEAMPKDQLAVIRKVMEHPEEKWLTYLKLADGQFIELFYCVSGDAKETLPDRRKYYGYTKMNYEVEDIRAIKNCLAECGVALKEDIHPTLDGSLEITVLDPDGNEVQFTQYGAAGQALLSMEDPEHNVCSRVKYTTQIALQVKDGINMLDFYTRGLGLKHAGRLTYVDLAGAMEKGKSADERQLTGLKMMGGKPWIDYIEVAPHQYIELFYTVGQELQEKRQLQGCYGYQHICLEVSDIRAAWDAVKTNGIVPDTEITLGADGAYQFWLTDPDGNRMELMEYAEGALQNS